MRCFICESKQIVSADDGCCRRRMLQRGGNARRRSKSNVQLLVESAPLMWMKGWIGNREVTVLRDTGSTGVMAKARLVDPSQYEDVGN